MKMKRTLRDCSLGLLLAALAVVLLLSITFAVAFGPVPIPALQVWKIALHHVWPDLLVPDWSKGRDSIVWDIRFPRVVLGAIVGAGLAVVGTVLQGITRNKLADPHLLGVSSGAAMGAVVVLLHIGMIFGGMTLPLGAFAGALLATMIIAGLAGRSGGTPDRLILLGVAVSFVLGAMTSLLIFMADHRASHVVVFWMLGGLGTAQWQNLWFPVGVLMVGLLYLQFRARHLNALMSGEETAATLGIEVGNVRLQLFVICALVTGTMVSVSGMIGFVGLMVPHIVRQLAGADHRRVLPLAGLGGAIFLIWADVAARTILKPEDMPIGIITGLVGGLFFIWITLRHRG
ncbi:iron ABC transporter permease [Thalassospira sp.]|uniref:FecCD family ABC transporter permease n=1 Tax=Thalassospira sp. TaxID=1912094 RepID=UPI00273530AC|nr:iron ABC transporter permease [Thalassospira sp.]MDP2700224.1 iron ABC transporter permease [Thalassospira sp.]